MRNNETACYDIFRECVDAIRNGHLIQAVSRRDKEFHFQNWFQGRLDALGLDFDEPRRNSYPDFRLVRFPEGYEAKGLATPGRKATYDSNSQVPTGSHHGRTIFYVFGRYPKNTADFPINNDGRREYPVIDLVLCHGDFLNVHHDYLHQNKSIRGFGSYGDILIRDRKMYVAPTPFALTDGTSGVYTLILPTSFPPDDRYEAVGHLSRMESDELVISYRFDLRTNHLQADTIPNPSTGTRHDFIAYRLIGQGGKSVTMVANGSNS